MTLEARQLNGQEVTYPPQFLPVLAWVPFTDGTHQQVRALAVAWTRQAVKVAWRTGGEEPTEHQAWVWAPAVRRAPLSGPHATDNPATNVNRRPRPEPGNSGSSGPVPEFRPSVRPPRTRPW